MACGSTRVAEPPFGALVWFPVVLGMPKPALS
jgi:hypothetical protein